MGANFDIARLVFALRHVFERNVGQRGQQVTQFLVGLRFGLLSVGNGPFQALDLGHQFRRLTSSFWALVFGISPDSFFSCA